MLMLTNSPQFEKRFSLNSNLGENIFKLKKASCFRIKEFDCYLFEFFLRAAISHIANFEVKSSRLKVHQFSGDYLSKWAFSDFIIISDFFLFN